MVVSAAAIYCWSVALAHEVQFVWEHTCKPPWLRGIIKAIQSGAHISRMVKAITPGRGYILKHQMMDGPSSVSCVRNLGQMHKTMTIGGVTRTKAG